MRIYIKLGLLLAALTVLALLASGQVSTYAQNDADVSISSQVVEAPAEIDVSEDVQATLIKFLHNYGPYDPVDVSISSSCIAPAGERRGGGRGGVDHPLLLAGLAHLPVRQQHRGDDGRGHRP
jgi:hypothetical protein